jgi:hypothetical protein
MRYKVAAVGLYVATSLIWIYGPVAANSAESYWWLLAIVALQLGFGVVVGEWWACLVPLLFIPLSMPAGYGSNTDSDSPVVGAVTILVLLAIPLVVIGVAARRAGNQLRRTPNRAVRGSPRAPGTAPPAASRR